MDNDETDAIEHLDEEPTLDQSKVKMTDEQMRLFCINSSVGMSIQGDTAWVPDTIKIARELYLFLSGRDPVVDFSGPTPDNVISLETVKGFNRAR